LLPLVIGVENSFWEKILFKREASRINEGEERKEKYVFKLDSKGPSRNPNLCIEAREIAMRFAIFW
jgi:hypothetical protein